MNIVERTLQRYGYEQTKVFNDRVSEAVKRELDEVHHWLGETADAQRWDLPYGGVDPVYANQSDMYRLSPLLGSALDVLANDVGLSKFNVDRSVGEDLRSIPNHEFEILLRAPNPLDSGLEFMRDTTMAYKLNGNSIWWLNRTSENEKPTELWPIPFEMITPVPDKRLYLSHYDYFPGMGKQAMPLPTWQIVQFKTYNPKNRFVGLSPIESLAMTLAGNQGMRRTKTRQYTEYGGAPQSILAFKDWMNNEAWADVKKEKKNAAMKNEMMMLRGVGDSVTWMSRAMSAKDAEFIENLQADMVDVFNRMTPGLLAMLDKNSTEANALAARATYSEKSLWATLEAFAQKITADILPAYGRKLIGYFDDPRVVDRKLALEEQAAYSLTHTVDQVNKKYYQEESLGDARGELLVSEARMRSTNSGGRTETNTETPNDIVTGEDTGSDDVALKAAIDDLAKWRRMALRGKAIKARGFTSAYIPTSVAAKIKRELPSAKSKDEIAAVFNAAMEHLKPKSQIDPVLLLQGIEAGVRALELR